MVYLKYSDQFHIESLTPSNYEPVAQFIAEIYCKHNPYWNFHT